MWYLDHSKQSLFSIIAIPRVISYSTRCHCTNILYLALKLILVHSLGISPTRCYTQLLSTDSLRLPEKLLRIVKLQRVGDQSKILLRQLSGVTHVVPVNSQVVTAAEHHQHNPGCLQKCHGDLSRRVYNKGKLSICRSHSCCAILPVSKVTCMRAKLRF